MPGRTIARQTDELTAKQSGEGTLCERAFLDVADASGRLGLPEGLHLGEPPPHGARSELRGLDANKRGDEVVDPPHRVVSLGGTINDDISRLVTMGKSSRRRAVFQLFFSIALLGCR